MRSESEVRAMLDKYDTSSDHLDYDDEEFEAVRSALLWVLGKQDESTLLGYLPCDC